MANLTVAQYVDYIQELRDIAWKNLFDGSHICDILVNIFQQDKFPGCEITKTSHNKLRYGFYDIIIDFIYKDRKYKCITTPYRNRMMFFALADEDKYGNNVVRSKLFKGIADTMNSAKLKGMRLLPKHRKYNKGDLFIMTSNVHRKPMVFRIIDYYYTAQLGDLSMGHSQIFYDVECHKDPKIYRVKENDIKGLCGGV